MADGTAQEAFTSRVAIEKTVDDKRLVFGWLYTCRKANGEQVVDHSGEIVEIDDLEEATYNFVLDARVAGVMHEAAKAKVPRSIGRLVESVVFTAEKRAAMGIPEGILPDATWCGFKIDDDNTWARVKSGELKMLSFGGTALKQALGG